MNRRPIAVLRHNDEAQQQPTTKATANPGGLSAFWNQDMTTALITLSAPAVVTVTVARNGEGKFDVLVDGEVFDSFGTFAAAMRDALSIFNARVELLH